MSNAVRDREAWEKIHFHGCLPRAARRAAPYSESSILRQYPKESMKRAGREILYPCLLSFPDHSISLLVSMLTFSQAPVNLPVSMLTPSQSTISLPVSMSASISASSQSSHQLSYFHTDFFITMLLVIQPVYLPDYLLVFEYQDPSCQGNHLRHIR